jgi:outer membrane protein OmpA-like peptidoglycan-associated protein
VICAFLTGWMVASAPAVAQEGPSLDVQRFDPVPQAATWTLVRDADLSRQGRFGVGLTGDWSWAALRVDGLGTGPVVDHLVGGNVTLHGLPTRWMSFGVQVPVVQALAGSAADDVQLGQVAANGRIGLGDTLFELAFAPVRGSEDQPMSLTIGPRLVLPTGSRSALVGSGSVGVGATAALAGAWPAVRFGVNLGFQVQTRSARFEDVWADDELRYGMGLALPFARDRWEAQIEAFGAAAIARAGKVALGPAWDPLRHAPMEALLAFQHRPARGGLFLRVGGGAGLTPAFGSPDVRLFAAMGWVAEPAGRREPALADRDRDGFTDDVDPCPSQAEDVDGVDDHDGCPEGDDDRDGIDVSADACPTVAEDFDRFEDGDGCPEPGPAAPAPSALALGPVYFDTNVADLDAVARAQLDKLAETLRSADARAVELRGHADERGGSRFNLELSSDRALAVKRYLVAAGVDPFLIKMVALGEAEPAVGFASAPGELAANRRVELVVVR